MVNTQAHESVIDCSDHNNSKYYVIVVQYTARLNAEKVRQFVDSLNNGKIPKRRFNFKLQDVSTGYVIFLPLQNERIRDFTCLISLACSTENLRSLPQCSAGICFISY